MFAASQIQSLTDLAEPVLTVYLNTHNVDPSRHPRVPDSMVWLRKEAETQVQSLQTQDTRQFQKAVARIEDFLKDRHPQEKALVLFAGVSHWTVLPLQAAVQNEICWGKPAVGQLFHLLGKHAPYGVVVVDQRVARFFELHLGGLTELDEEPYEVGQIATEQMHKGRGPDPDLYAHRLDAQYERLWKETAEHVASLSKEHGFSGLFLVGPERLVSSLHKHFALTVPFHVVTLHEDLGQFSATDIRQRIEPLAAEYEQKLQLPEVQKLLAADAGSVLGADEALAKLQQGMIGTLFVAEGHELYLRECSQCRSVSRTADSVCAECGGERRKVGMFETLARLASVHGTRLEFVSGAAADILTKSGGVAGWLRQSKKVALG